MFFTYGFEKKAKELVRGGKADGHKDSEYPAEQIRKGQKIEKEHTGDPALAREIARDHLEEDKEKGINPPNYYDRLEKVEKKAFELGFSKAARELTTKSRNKLPDASFVFPRERRYPIHDEAHARNALARVSQFGTKSEKDAVRAAVHSRYPSIGKEASDKTAAMRDTLRKAVANIGHWTPEQWAVAGGVGGGALGLASSNDYDSVPQKALNTASGALLGASLGYHGKRIHTHFKGTTPPSGPRPYESERSSSWGKHNRGWN